MTTWRQMKNDSRRAIILAALEQTRGNVTRAALLLDLTRNGLQKAMVQLGLVRHVTTAYETTQVRSEVPTSVENSTHQTQPKVEDSDLGDFLSWHDK